MGSYVECFLYSETKRMFMCKCVSRVHHVPRLNWCKSPEKKGKHWGKSWAFSPFFFNNFFETVGNLSPEMEELQSEGTSIHELNTEIGDLLLQIQEVITGLGLRIKQKVVQTANVLCMLHLLVFVAIFLYVGFYYTFMPTASFITPVHFHYRWEYINMCPTVQILS